MVWCIKRRALGKCALVRATIVIESHSIQATCTCIYFTLHADILKYALIRVHHLGIYIMFGYTQRGYRSTPDSKNGADSKANLHGSHGRSTEDCGSSLSSAFGTLCRPYVYCFSKHFIYHRCKNGIFRQYILYVACSICTEQRQLIDLDLRLSIFDWFQIMSHVFDPADIIPETMKRHGIHNGIDAISDHFR